MQQWVARQPGAERLAFHQFHSDVGLAFGLAHFVNGADVGVVEGSGGARLAQQPRASLLVAKAAGRKHLQGHVPLELFVVRFINDAHAALSQFLVDAVMPECLPNHAAPPPATNLTQNNTNHRSRMWKRSADSR